MTDVQEHSPNKYSMRINEDFIDDQSVQDVITSSDDDSLSMKYPYSFFFTTKLIRRRIPENVLIQMLTKFCTMFTRMVAGLPAVKHFNKDDFQIYMGGAYLFRDFDPNGTRVVDDKHPFIRYSYKTVIVPGGFKVHFSDEDNANTLGDYFSNYNSFADTSLGFFINIDANMETISKIHKMWLTLWSIFEKALKHSFDFWCEPQTIFFYADGVNIFESGNPYINSTNQETWKGKTIMMTKVMLTNVMRKYHPEIDVIEATRQVNDFISTLNK